PISGIDRHSRAGSMRSTELSWTDDGLCASFWRLLLVIIDMLRTVPPTTISYRPFSAHRPPSPMPSAAERHSPPVGAGFAAPVWCGPGSALTQVVSTPRGPVPNERRRRRLPHGRRTGTTGEWLPATRGSLPTPAKDRPGREPPPRGR